MSETPAPKSYPPPPRYEPEKDVVTRMIIPVGRSGWAIASGYLALFSLMILPAPFALLTGVLAISDINKSKATQSPKLGMGRAIFGIVMGSLGTAALLWFVIMKATT